MVSEFALIDRLFRRPTRHTVLGVGDDGALIQPSPGQQLVVSTDLLVENTHFFPSVDPRDLGWKTLAVNVSDLAAMGAQPRWATLAAVLPAPTFDELHPFADGFFACADAFGIDLIGGDTTRGPRAFCVTIFGEVPAGAALRRDGAQRGDSIWISGHPGRAALGLAHLQGRTVLPEPQLSLCLHALHRLQPRLSLGLALRGLATAAIDISDGLLAYLGHILQNSQRSAQLRIPGLPADPLARACLLSGGDDYELAFTAPAACDDAVRALAATLPLPLTRIGHIDDGLPGQFTLIDDMGTPIHPERLGYDHFA